MSSLTGKLEADLEISASAINFYEMFCNTPSQLTSICPGIILSCNLLEGEWGILGSITQWTYVLGGETKVANLIIEAADSTNNSIIFRVLEGDLMLQFSFFKITIVATQNDEGSLVSLTLEYIKLSLDVEDPQTLLELGIQVFKLLDAYLIAQA